MARPAWEIDPADPRAPSVEVWEKLSDVERERVCANLPSEIERAFPPEGDRHRVPKTRALEALGEFFRRIGRRVYLSSELPVYYPAERMFAPDVIAVLDVESHERDSWVVSKEGKGVDFALEVTLGGDPKKDLLENVDRYARLGISEYFVLDARTARLSGYRLPPGEPAYKPIVPQKGRWSSSVLGLDLALEGGRVRFFHGSAPLLEAAELIAKLETMMEEIVRKKEEVERERDAAARERDAAARERDAAARERDAAARERDAVARERDAAEARAERLAQRLRELGIDPDKT